MDIAYILQGFFLLAASTIVFVNAIEALQSRFLAYGARASIQEPRPLEQQRWLMSMLDRLARLRVPHKWFIHFYIVSVLSSVFWLQQLLTRGVGFQLIGSRMKTTQNSHSMSFNQVFLCSALLMAQGARRLMESISLAKPSQSRMWFVHWLLGIGFYIAMGVGVWIEGRGAFLSTTDPIGNARIDVPSLRTLVSLPLFLLASGMQNDCHRYLASLKKYSLPSHPAFASIICPHYTAECAIYLSLTVLAAPKGAIINQTLLTALIFVVVNLGISADLSRKWYVEEFGAKSVGERWRMIPYLW